MADPRYPYTLDPVTTDVPVLLTLGNGTGTQGSDYFKEALKLQYETN